MTPDVIRVLTQPGHLLLVQFATGEWRRFDMREHLKYPAFAALRDPAFFRRASVRYGTVVWNDEIDLSPDTLYLRGEAVASPPQAAAVEPGQ